jgi:hypothetical protein
MYAAVETAREAYDKVELESERRKIDSKAGRR